MLAHAPRTILATHEVGNQPPEFIERNLFTLDRPMVEAVEREGGAWAMDRITAFGAEAGREEVADWAEQANRHTPELMGFDRYGRRIDEARFHPAYHSLMSFAMGHGLHDVAWRREGAGGHVAHAAMMTMMNGVESGITCPVSMTYACVPALRHSPSVAERWLPKIIGGQYDAKLRPIADKRGVTLGMAMTEKQGGSDVRANTTRAEPDGADGYRVTGHKWFCSAPMSDAFLTLAYTDAGLTCFLMPRILPDGERNTIQVMRLKDKLGNKSNASSEIEYHSAYGELIGEEGRGVNAIIDMVHHTRLDTMTGGLGIMRMALVQAIHHTRHRRAFQKTLIDQPLMRGVLGDLALELEGMTALLFRVARAFDLSANDKSEQAFARLAVAVGKYWINKRAPGFVYECMECLGGAGYVEESVMPRLYREAPLNSIWEGSGNVICLDVLRTFQREPMALDALRAEIGLSAGASPILDQAIEALDQDIVKCEERHARRMVETIALVLQAGLLIRSAPNAVADAFIATRFGGGGGRCYGSNVAAIDSEVLLKRAFNE